MTAQEYISEIRYVIGDKLINPNSIYHGRSGHERFARECGYALNDFSEKEQERLLKDSYSSIYVIGCNLKPILDAKEWIGIMRSQIKEKY